MYRFTHFVQNVVYMEIPKISYIMIRREYVVQNIMFNKQIKCENAYNDIVTYYMSLPCI